MGLRNGLNALDLEGLGRIKLRSRKEFGGSPHDQSASRQWIRLIRGSRNGQRVSRQGVEGLGMAKVRLGEDWSVSP